MKIQPKISQNLQEYIDTTDLFSVKGLHDGVVHIGFPQEIENNIEKFQTVAEGFDVKLNLYLAHKATKNQAFVKQAKKCGIGIDVSSRNELISALSCGFTSLEIEATGPKNNEFMRLAFFHSCLISLDSIEELHRLIQIAQSIGSNQQICVTIRLNNPKISGRNVNIKNSRFGSNCSQLAEFYTIFKQYSFFNFKGFHFHSDGYDPTMRAGILESMLELIQESYSFGFSPDIINLGGAFRDQTLENYNQWSNYVEQLEELLLNNQELPTLNNQGYELYVNEKGKIGGKDKALSRFYNSSPDRDLKTILGAENNESRILADILNENMFELALEPGYALLQQAGITLIEVIESKQSADGTNLVVVDANLYNLGLAKMFQYITDPIHIVKTTKKVIETEPQNKFEAMVVGNMCREDDYLIQRLIIFDTRPKTGDLLIFTNTAPYFAGFEDATPIMHPKSKFLAAYKSNSTWKTTIPENYNPYEK